MLGGVDLSSLAMAERKNQLHAVIVPYPGQGHINPLMQLAMRLAEDLDFFVTFACPKGNLDAILRAWQKAGIPAPLERGLSIHLRPVADDVLPPRRMDAIHEFIVGCKKLKDPFRDVLDQISQDAAVPPISCIVSDVILSWGLEVADAIGVPWIVYYPLPASSLLVQLRLQDANFSAGTFELQGLPPLLDSELPAFAKWKDRSEIAVMNRGLRSAAYVITNTCEALESREIEELRLRVLPRLVPLGPLQPVEFIRGSSPNAIPTSTLWSQESSCLSWLDAQPRSSVLYVSFGSIASQPLEEMEKLLDALLASGEAFLWVIRSGFMDDEDWLRFEAAARNCGRGCVVQWAPQLEVLRHTAIAAFLTHCGWNSTFEAIVAGVPLITWPCFADQGLNSKYIVDVWRIGLRISPTSCVEDMASVIRNGVRGGAACENRKRAVALSEKCSSTENSLMNLRKIAQSLTRA